MFNRIRSLKLQMRILLQISGDGVLDPAVSSRRPTLRTAYNNFESSSLSSGSVIFYSSEEDPNAKFLVTPLNFKISVLTVESDITAAVVLTISINMIILTILAYLINGNWGGDDESELDE